MNDRPDTAPSKRIARTYRYYRKTVDGPMIIDALGFATVRAQCPHANERFSAIENILGL